MRGPRELEAATRSSDDSSSSKAVDHKALPGPRDTSNDDKEE